MLLLYLTSLLIGPYLILTLIQKINPKFKITNAAKFRIGVSLLFLAGGMGHFTKTAEMARIIPPIFPNPELLVILTAFPELFGAIGIWIPKLRKLTGALLIAWLIGILPFNIYAAIEHIDVGGHGAGPVYLLIRVPLQFLAMWCTYLAAELSWFKPTSK